VSWHWLLADSGMLREHWQRPHIAGTAEVQPRTAFGTLLPEDPSSQQAWVCPCIGPGFLQTFRHPVVDTLMSAMAMTVSIEFYTAFLPVLFWVSTLFALHRP